VVYVDSAMSEQLLTVGEVAERLRISSMTIYRWIEEGRLPAMQIGKQYRVRAADLDEVLEGSRVGVERSDPWTGKRPVAPSVE
jgi:excisionase family DNA binding protein